MAHVNLYGCHVLLARVVDKYIDVVCLFYLYLLAHDWPMGTDVFCLQELYINIYICCLFVLVIAQFIVVNIEAASIL